MFEAFRKGKEDEQSGRESDAGAVGATRAEVSVLPLFKGLLQVPPTAPTRGFHPFVAQWLPRGWLGMVMGPFEIPFLACVVFGQRKVWGMGVPPDTKTCRASYTPEGR